MVGKQLHDIVVEYKFSTEKANLYTDGTKELWVAKSLLGEDGMIEVTKNDDGTYTLTAPEWWLKARGLI